MAKLGQLHLQFNPPIKQLSRYCISFFLSCSNVTSEHQKCSLWWVISKSVYLNLKSQQIRLIIIRCQKWDSPSQTTCKLVKGVLWITFAINIKYACLLAYWITQWMGRWAAPIHWILKVNLYYKSIKIIFWGINPLKTRARVCKP